MNRIQEILKNLYDDKRNLAILLIITLIIILIYIMFNNSNSNIVNNFDINVREDSSERIVFEVNENISEDEKKNLTNELQQRNPGKDVIVQNDYSYSESKRKALELKYETFEFDEQTGDFQDPIYEFHEGTYGN